MKIADAYLEGDKEEEINNDAELWGGLKKGFQTIFNVWEMIKLLDISAHLCRLRHVAPLLSTPDSTNSIFSRIWSLDGTKRRVRSQEKILLTIQTMAEMFMNDLNI